MSNNNPASVCSRPGGFSSLLPSCLFCSFHCFSIFIVLQQNSHASAATSGCVLLVEEFFRVSCPESVRSWCWEKYSDCSRSGAAQSRAPLRPGGKTAACRKGQRRHSGYCWKVLAVHVLPAQFWHSTVVLACFASHLFTLFSLQAPYFWPSNCWEPENTDYGESLNGVLWHFLW